MKNSKNCLFHYTQCTTELVIAYKQTICTTKSDVKSWLKNLPKSVCTLLIADEVHNLGVPSFIQSPPEFISVRIGLSATPIRQYDPDGTDALFDFFGGPPVFEFSLREAIKCGCLVPYNYYLRKVDFTKDEMDIYEEFTRQIATAGY